MHTQNIIVLILHTIFGVQQKVNFNNYHPHTLAPSCKHMPHITEPESQANASS